MLIELIGLCTLGKISTAEICTDYNLFFFLFEFVISQKGKQSRIVNNSQRGISGSRGIYVQKGVVIWGVLFFAFGSLLQSSSLLVLLETDSTGFPWFLSILVNDTSHPSVFWIPWIFLSYYSPKSDFSYAVVTSNESCCHSQDILEH